MAPDLDEMNEMDQVGVVELLQLGCEQKTKPVTYQLRVSQQYPRH